MLERRRLRARGLVFDVLTVGDPAGEPVLLLHGFPQTAACWTRLTGALAGAGYRVLAPDQRGYSPGAAGGRARLPDGGAGRRRPGAGRPGQGGGAHPPGRPRLGRDGGLASGRPAPRAGGHPDRGVDPAPARFAAALRSSAQPLRSAYIAFFRTPRLPELVLGARGLSGLRLLLAGSGLGSEWVEAYAGALADRGALAAALAWYRAAGPSTLRVPAVAVPTCHLWGSGDPALGRRATVVTARWLPAPTSSMSWTGPATGCPSSTPPSWPARCWPTCGAGRPAQPAVRDGRRDAGRGRDRQEEAL
jgi:hypothetical protein